MLLEEKGEYNEKFLILVLFLIFVGFVLVGCNSFKFISDAKFNNYQEQAKDKKNKVDVYSFTSLENAKVETEAIELAIKNNSFPIVLDELKSWTFVLDLTGTKEEGKEDEKQLDKVTKIFKKIGVGKIYEH